MEIAVVGAGHAGLVSAAGMAAVGHQVRVLDVDRRRIERLRAGSVPFFEPGLEQLVGDARSTERISFHVDAAEALGGASLIFLCVGTPNGHHGQPDLGAVTEATRTVGEHAAEGSILVNRSTAPVGTAHHLRGLMRERRGEAVGVASNPEFLAEGSAVHDFLRPDRVIVGVWDDEAAARLREVYAPILRPEEGSPVLRYTDDPEPGAVPFLVTDPHSAELAKYAANAFLAVKISFINEIAQIAEELGADITRVAVALGLDSRVGPKFLRAGVGWGGSCFPKDILALQGMAETRGVAARMLRAANDVNADQHAWVIRKLEDRLKSLSGRRVGLLGLAFKPQTDDIRNAPALEIASMLRDRGVKVRAFDPYVKQLPKAFDGSVELAEDPKALARGMDALVLVTEWPEFSDLDLRSLARVMRRRLLLDGRNALDPFRAEAAGFTYVAVGLGRPPTRGVVRGEELEWEAVGSGSAANGRKLVLAAVDGRAVRGEGDGKPAATEKTGDTGGASEERTVVAVPESALGDLRRPLTSILQLTNRMRTSEALSSAARELLARLGNRAESLDGFLGAVAVTVQGALSPDAQTAAPGGPPAAAQTVTPARPPLREPRPAPAGPPTPAGRPAPAAPVAAPPVHAAPVPVAPVPVAPVPVAQAPAAPSPAADVRTGASPSSATPLPPTPAGTSSAFAKGKGAVQTDVAELVQRVVGEEATGPQVEFVLDAASVVVDPASLRAAFVRLLHNAVERSHPSLPIVVGVGRAEGGVFVAVQDRNSAPPAGLAANGRRGTEGRLLSQGGGTGLAEVDDFVQRSEGHAWVENEPGRGNTYWLFIRDPVDAAAADGAVDGSLANAASTTPSD